MFGLPKSTELNRPLSKKAVFDKFKMLAGAVLKPSRVDAALNAIMSMEQAGDVRKIVDTVIPLR
jgi:hypothetical protein